MKGAKYLYAQEQMVQFHEAMMENELFDVLIIHNFCTDTKKDLFWITKETTFAK